MPRRSVSSDASGPDSPPNSRATLHQVSGVWTSRDRSGAAPSPQQPGRLPRCTSTWMRGAGSRASERMASAVFRSVASRPVRPGGRRSSTFRLSRRLAAMSTPSTMSHGAPSRTAAEPSDRSSRLVASITSTEGPWPRRNWRHERWIGSPAPPHSASPDSCSRCSRWNGVRDWARARPGIAPARVGAGGAEPAREAAPGSSHAGSWSSLMVPP